MWRENGAATVAAIVGKSVMSTVTLAEVATKVVNATLKDHPHADPAPLAEEARAALKALGVQFLPFSAYQAQLAGRLHRPKANLALGDRACLALALSLDLPVYTGDQKWRTHKLAPPEAKVELIR